MRMEQSAADFKAMMMVIRKCRLSGCDFKDHCDSNGSAAGAGQFVLCGSFHHFQSYKLNLLMFTSGPCRPIFAEVQQFKIATKSIAAYIGNTGDRGQFH